MTRWEVGSIASPYHALELRAQPELNAPTRQKHAILVEGDVVSTADIRQIASPKRESERDIVHDLELVAERRVQIGVVVRPRLTVPDLVLRFRPKEADLCLRRLIREGDPPTPPHRRDARHVGAAAKAVPVEAGADDVESAVETDRAAIQLEEIDIAGDFEAVEEGIACGVLKFGEFARRESCLIDEVARARCEDVVLVARDEGRYFEPAKLGCDLDAEVAGEGRFLVEVCVASFEGFGRFMRAASEEFDLRGRALVRGAVQADC